MTDILVNVAIAYFAGLLLVAPALPRGRVRRAAELVYAPFVRLGLWYRWSMYAPEAPMATQLAIPFVVFADGSSESVRLPGFDDQRPGTSGGLRFVALQWALCDAVTDHLKPAVCARALAAWEAQRGPGEARAVVAVELRVHRYPTPPPGSPACEIRPEIEVVWREPVGARES